MLILSLFCSSAPTPKPLFVCGSVCTHEAVVFVSWKQRLQSGSPTLIGKKRGNRESSKRWTIRSLQLKGMAVGYVSTWWLNHQQEIWKMDLEDFGGTKINQLLNEMLVMFGPIGFPKVGYTTRNWYWCNGWLRFINFNVGRVEIMQKDLELENPKVTTCKSCHNWPSNQNGWMTGASRCSSRVHFVGGCGKWLGSTHLGRETWWNHLLRGNLTWDHWIDTADDGERRWKCVWWLKIVKHEPRAYD